ncbi:hypothetical protein AREALGSMS7_02982 [Arenibacter algicola]|uniref:Uncharacterized protein n=1 Tax=Arenibacter algicola TaxID=616991 RepID=A0A221UYG7_9FLAO|nr:hypothetical protein AREALGSMS7_02982 [Arenibacter algicola]
MDSSSTMLIFSFDRLTFLNPNLTQKLCAWILLDFFSVREDKRKEEIQ